MSDVLMFSVRIFVDKDRNIFLLARNLRVFFMRFVGRQKKRRPESLLFRFVFGVNYFTMNFMVFSKPLAFTVTK